MDICGGNVLNRYLSAVPATLALALTLPAVFLLASLATVPAMAESVKISTWNIEHLRELEGEGKAPRTEADYRRLRHYAQLLDADVIAVQEVESAQALGRVFDPRRYRFLLSNRSHIQRTGFAVRASIAAKRHPDRASVRRF